MVKSYELVTLYRDGESVTWLLKDFEKYGDKATPLWIRQYPAGNQPFHEIKLQDADGFMKHRTVSEEDIREHESGWNVEQVQKLLSAAGPNNEYSK